MVLLAALQSLFLPTSLLRTTLPTLFSALSPTHLRTITPLMVQIGGAWLHLGLTDLVVLRRTQAVPVWRACLTASAVSDASYLASLLLDWSAGGTGWPSGWSLEQWVSVGLTVPFTVGKIAFVLGVGLPGGDEVTAKRKD
jgi:hypothetical protein